jgi:hypothetical protein
MGQNYINWTGALINYFFCGRDASEEVFLYVDERILDQIGEENGLGDHNDFLSTVLLTQEERAKLYDQLYYQGYLSRRSPQVNQIIQDSHNILQFAKCLSERKDQQLYFPYIILVIYIASLTDNNSDTAVGGFLKQFLREHLQDENGNYSALEFLFEKLHKDYPQFSNKTRGHHRYVGLLKYQLLLSKNEIKEIQEALNKISYEEDFNTTYVDKIRKIKDYVKDHVKLVLKESLSKYDYQYRINNIFESFDLESYREARQDTATICYREDFALFLDFSEGRGFRLLSSYRPTGKTILYQGGNRFTFTPSIDSIDTYNDEFVNYNENYFVELKEFSLSTERMEIKPIALGNVVFFYKYSDGGYIQSRNAYNRKVYVFVKKDRRENNICRWEAWANQHAINCKRIDENYEVSDLTNNVWALYLADGLTAPYYTKEDNWDLTCCNIGIVRRGGIICSNEKNVYLINALPYFEFSNNIQREHVTIEIHRENGQNLQKPLLEGDDYRCFIQSNRLIIDLLKDLDFSESRKIEVNIKYTNPTNGETVTTEEVFWVRGQSISYDQNNLYRFDKWGEKTDNDEMSVQGNIVSGIAKNSLGRASHSLDVLEFSDIHADHFYFINLLASSIYMESDGKITRDKLKKCIKYAATRLNISVNEDGFVTMVISLLVNCGYITADYRTSHYQAIPPAFIKIPRSFHAGSTNQVWMLTGAYTRKFMKDLDDFCTKNADGSERKVSVSKKFRYSKTLDNSRGSLKLLPPIILLASNFDPEEFKKRFPYHFFDIIKTYDQALDLLSLVSPISEYGNTMESIPRERVDVSRFIRPKSNEFPRVREDNPYEYNNHIYIENSGEGDFLKPSISEKWNELFCYYKRNKPFIIKGTQHIYLPEDLRLPSLIQRSLFIMNVGLPAYKKVFLCDNPSSMMFTRMKSYKINDDRLQTVYKILTGTIDFNNLYLRERIVSAKNNKNEKWAYHLKLWSKQDKEELNKRIPDRILVLEYANYRYNTSEIVAASSLFKNKKGHIQSTYVMKEGRLFEVTSSCNEIMSFIIKHPYWQYKDIHFAEHPAEFVLPSRDLYDIEEITIL